MKVVIIEGLDNTGKTTVIHRLMSMYDKVYYVHCQKPKAKDPILAALEQQESYTKIANMIVGLAINEKYRPDLVILDRSWLGEFVYGCRYRGNGQKFVLDMISKCASILSEYNNSADNLYSALDYHYILLTADDPRFCIKHDDGKSISEADMENIEYEMRAFDTVFTINIPGLFNRHKVIVNDGLEFRDKDTIFNEILDIINK